jgi:hypothetical protein
VSALEEDDEDMDHDIDASGAQGSVQHTECPPSPPPLSAAACYLPNVIVAIAASVGVVVGSVGPWASPAWVTANGATADVWWQGKTTFILGAVAGIALLAVLNRGRTGSRTRWLAPLAWIAPVAGLVCLLIAIVNVVNVTSTSHHLVGLQVGWGLWLVAISAVVLCAMAAVAAAQIGTATEGFQAGMRTAIVISAIVLLGVAMYFPIRWAAINPPPRGDPHPPIGPSTTAPLAQSTPPFPIPATAAPPPQDPEVVEVQQLWQTAVQKHHPVQDFLAAVQAAGIVGAEPALLENGYRVCWELWKGGYDGVQAAVATQKSYPTLTLKQAAHFVLAAYDNLCPVPADANVYDWWRSGGGAGAGGGGPAAGG